MSALPYQSIPLVKGLPLVGNLPKFLRSPLDNARSLEVHGNVVRSRTFFETVTLLGPDANQFVLHDREGNFSNRGGWQYWIDSVFPGAIMAMDDPPSPAAQTLKNCRRVTFMLTCLLQGAGCALVRLDKWSEVRHQDAVSQGFPRGRRGADAALEGYPRARRNRALAPSTSIDSRSMAAMTVAAWAW